MPGGVRLSLAGRCILVLFLLLAQDLTCLAGRIEDHKRSPAVESGASITLEKQLQSDGELGLLNDAKRDLSKSAGKRSLLDDAKQDLSKSAGELGLLDDAKRDLSKSVRKRSLLDAVQQVFSFSNSHLSLLDASKQLRSKSSGQRSLSEVSKQLDGSKQSLSKPAGQRSWLDSLIQVLTLSNAHLSLLDAANRANSRVIDE